MDIRVSVEQTIFVERLGVSAAELDTDLRLYRTERLCDSRKPEDTRK